ncbi:hypothetical protein [Marinicella meishanensis]|uniref:hypothetical protein n=1 Tax=Marinicella meishanensis TaxID=2873263 RepID=UPI001CBEB4C8|nr:hypothetical protein [Marinicella sp. NBU2979]
MESRDYLEMSFRSIECFSNDGKLDAEELGRILAIAERDGEIDHNEIRVLRNIISRLTPEELDADMQAMLKKVHDKINAS